MTSIEKRLAALEAEVAGLRGLVAIKEALLEAVRDMGYDRGRESILGTREAARPRCPRHLHVVGGAR